MGENNDNLKLFIGGLGRETDNERLKSYFMKYGRVNECIVAEDRETGLKRGFGFVTFDDFDGFNRALNDSHVINNTRVDVKKAIPRGEQLRNQNHGKSWSKSGFSNNDKTSNNSQFRTKKIFVGGLSPTVTESEFKSYFEQFGSLSDVVVMHDNVTNRPRGFGFITFDSEESVVEVTRNSYHELGGKYVEVKRAVPKDEVIENGSSSSRLENGSSSSRLENGIVSFTGHQFGKNIPYAYGSLPVHRPVSTGYGGTLGYTYGSQTPFGPALPGGFFYGVSYEVACVGPTSPLMIPPPMFGFGGSPLPFGSISTFYPTYLNGGNGILGTPNGVVYSGFPNVGVFKDSFDLGNGGQLGANIPSSAQITEIDSNGPTMVGTMDQ